jgi:hypothetical protein
MGASPGNMEGALAFSSSVRLAGIRELMQYNDCAWGLFRLERKSLTT